MKYVFRVLGFIWFFIAWWRQTENDFPGAAYAMASACFWMLLALWERRAEAPRDCDPPPPGTDRGEGTA